MKSPVVFDLDGVLADYRAAYLRLCRDLGMPEPVGDGGWNDYTDAKVWRVIKASVDFWVSLPPLVARQTFGRIRALRDERDVYFATARPGRFSHWQSVQWLTAQGVENPAVVVTSRKGEFAKVVDAGFLLDDKAGNCVYTVYESPRTRTYLLDRPWNQFNHDALGSKVLRVDTVEEFLDAVEGAS